MKRIFRVFKSGWTKVSGLFVIGLLVPLSIMAQDITTGLRLHYTFDEVTGSTVNDESGNNNNGSLQGGASLVTGYSGQGVQCLFKADYIGAPANINAGLTSFTFATWVKFSSLRNATRFFDWGTGADATNNFLAFIPSFNGDDGYMVMRYRPVSGTAYNITSTEKCPVGSWAHVAITFNWNSSTNRATAIIYLNGEAVGTTTNLPFNPALSLGNTQNNYFGYSRWGQDTNGFNGIFDDIRVYDRALTAEDIVGLAGMYELNQQLQSLELGDLSAVTSNLDLPAQGPDYPEISIEWSSSNPQIISNTGVVARPMFFDSPVTLTATLTLGLNSKVKTFVATVLAQEGSSFSDDLLVRFDFSNLNDRTVTDVAEKQFEGTLMNVAGIRTIGTSETGIYNVLDLGNNNGYFDLGADVGRVVSHLHDYTMGAYFRIDAVYTGLGSHGNFIWSFSNSENAGSSQNGYIIGSLKDQSVSITPGFYTAASGNQAVSFGREALKGNWHHIAYTQSGNTGTLYIDGVAMISSRITNTPKSALVKDGLAGTLYNWLGRSCYPTDVYLRRTMVYDFRIYNRALSAEEILVSELNVPENIAHLEDAYKAYLGVGKTDETMVIEKTINPKASALEILSADNSSTKVNLETFEQITFADAQMTVKRGDGVDLVYQTGAVRKMLFVDGPTQLISNKNYNTLELQPNPALDYIWLRNMEGGSQTVYIYTLTGNLLVQKRIEASNEKIDVSSLPAGVYVVKTGHQVAKFVKK